MQVKVIYEDDAVLSVKALIAQLDTEQLFFVEQFIRRTKAERKQEVFQQWQTTLSTLINKP